MAHSLHSFAISPARLAGSRLAGSWSVHEPVGELIRLHAWREHGSGEPIGTCDRSLRSPGQQFAPAQLTRAGKNAPSALPFATRAGSPTQRGHHAAGAFYLIEPRPLTLTCANRCPGSRADLGSHVEGSGRCPPGPCRCWAAGPVWSGPRAAEPRFVRATEAHRTQENRRGDSRGEFGLCDPRRSHATTGASVRLASVAQAHPLLAATASAARVRGATVFRPAEAGRGRPVPARRAHGSGEPSGPVTDL